MPLGASAIGHPGFFWAHAANCLSIECVAGCELSGLAVKPAILQWVPTPTMYRKWHILMYIKEAVSHLMHEGQVRWVAVRLSW